MALQITGKITQITDIETGTGKNGEWSKQNFAIETDGEYPKMVVFSAMGKVLDYLKNKKVGNSVTVSFNPESREYQNKFYTDLKAWKIE
jgi:hypothetical protein